eukprot:g21485.t1
MNVVCSGILKLKRLFENNSLDNSGLRCILPFSTAWRTSGTLPNLDSFIEYVGKFCFDFKKHAPGMVCKATFAHCDFLMMGSTDVFFGSQAPRAVKGKDAPQVAKATLDEAKVSDVMQLKEVLRGFGRAAGATAAFQLSESCRGCNEALRPILPLISQEAPYIYVSGGSCGLVVDSAERLNPRRRGRTRWHVTLPSMCIPRRACATASTGGRFYVLGGVDRFRHRCGHAVPGLSGMDPCIDAGGGGGRHRVSQDPTTSDRWELLPAMNRPYTHAAATALGGYIYVFGGLSFGHVLDQAQRFAHGQWECLDPMPTPRFECTAAATKGRIYVLGGSNISGEALGCVECYEPSSGLWRQLPEMRQARYGSAISPKHPVPGRVYVFGGHSHWENLSDCECYDAELERWFPLPAMAAPRSHCGAAAAGGRIYVFGGHTNGQDIMTIDCLDPETLSWEVEPLQMPRPRSHCMTATVQS